MIDPESQEYLEDTITVYEAKVKEDGTLEKGDEFDASNYELTVEEDEFTIAWNDEVDRAYIVEYSTLFFAKDQEEVTNNYKITGDSIEEDAESGSSVIVRQTESGGSGQSGYLIVEKLDTTYGQDINPLEGITFEVIDKETGQVLKTVSTDADGYAEFGRLLFGTYILKEVNTPEGYVGFDEQEIEINKPYDPSVEETYMFEVENYKRNGDVEILNVDEEENSLEGAEFKLFTEDGVEVDTKTTNEDGKLVFENLEPGNYYIQETEAPTGYLLNETKHDIEITETQKEPIELKIENKINYKTYTTEVSVEKVWKGEEADNVTVTLFADGEEETVKITAEDEWKHTFTDLQKYTADLEEIEYTVEESLEGYETEISGDQKDGFTITNTRTGETEVSVEKVWKGSEEESVTINLLANGEEKDTIDLFEENDWNHVFENLPAFDDEGQPIKYTVQELEIDGYTSEITGDAKEGFTVTNTRTGETEIPVEKVWEDRDNKHELRPDNITVNLLANDEEVNTEKLSEENDWSHVFTDLDAYDENDEAIEYTVEEVEVAEYRTDITGNAEEGYTITNTVKDYAIGDYVWVDRNKDGIQDDNEEPLEGVKVELYDNEGNKIAETETDENGRYIFDELPAGEYKVKFTLTEEQAEKYRFTKEQAGDDTSADSDADEETGWTRKIILNDDNEFLTKDYEDQEFNATEGIDPTWDAGVVELVRIPIEKVWIDNDNVEESRPEAITVNVLENGDVVTTADLTAEDNWAHIFKGLDKYDENGEEIVYTVEEETIEGYEVKIEKTEEGYVLTNTRTGEIDVSVEKVWKGEVAKSVIIHLLANGEDVDTIELSEDNDWSYIFTDLAEFDQAGKRIEYKVDEVAVEGYKTEITGDVDKCFTVTNTRTGETDLVIEKVWENDESDDRPLSIMGDILQNGEEYSTFRITAEDDWILTVTDLPEFDEDGEPYEYTVVEHEVDSYESEITETKEGFTITNTYTPDESGNGLPKTATNMYNFLFLGGVILLLGLIILGYTRRRA